MKLIKCVSAFHAVCELMTVKDYETAFVMLSMKDRLAQHAKFHSEKTVELVKEFYTKDDKGDYHLDVSDNELLISYQQAVNKLNNTEVEFEKSKLNRIPPEITGNQLEAIREVFILPERETCSPE